MRLARKKSLLRLLPLAAVSSIMFVSASSASATLVTVTLDENGNGFLSPNNLTLQGVLGADPNPGGLASVLTYTLPINFVTGDVLIKDPVTLALSDVLRFSPGKIYVYSDNSGGGSSLADVGFPSSFFVNNVSIPEGATGVSYSPTAGQPGYINSDFTPTYNFTSDSAPEPSSVLMFFSGAVGLGLRRFRRS
jgi:hypothetical protein